MKESTTKKISIAILLFSAAIVVLLSMGGHINFTQAAVDDHPEVNTRSFYDGAVIRLIIPNNPGGGYDEYGRLISGFLERYTGARVQLVNLPGSGGMRALGELFKAPADGLTLGLINGSGIAFNQVAETSQMGFEIEKLSFIGRVSRDIRVLTVPAQGAYPSFEDILGARQALKFGATGFGGSTYVDAVISRHIFNLDVDVIHGFNNSSAVRLAMLSGKLDGAWSSLGSVSDEVASGQFSLVLQIGEERNPILPGVPTTHEFNGESLTPDLLQERLRIWSELHDIGRPLVAPPGIAPERLAYLREAFRLAMHDQALINRAAMSGRSIDYASGEEMEKYFEDLTQISPEIQAYIVESIRGEL